MGCTGGSGGLIDQVRTGLSAVADGATVVVAVSGGPDSVALLHLVVAARPDLHVVVGHVRHGPRDDAADAAAARANADALTVPYVERSARVQQGEGPEDAARTARYDALRSIATDAGAVAVVVGHTMDDQAETVLLRIARGTGIGGLAGMDVVSHAHGVPVLRPLLGLRRTDVRASAAGHPTIEDPTNTDPDQRRARARAEVLPALRRLHPAEADVVPLLARLADFARQATAPSSDIPSAAAEPTGPTGGGAGTCERFGMAVDVRWPDDGEDAALRAAWALLPDAPAWPGGGAAQRLRQLAVGRTADLPGAVRATRLRPAGEGGRLVLCRLTDPCLPAVQLDVPGEVAVPGFGALRAAPSPMDGDRRVPADERWQRWSWTADVAGDHPPLVVRGRSEQGDRAARRVLQRFPAALRRQVPLVVDAAGRVMMAGPVVLQAPAPGGPSIRLTADPV